MQAAIYSAFGKARDVLRVQAIETPTPKAGEVLVRVSFSGVNPSDVKARAGSRPGVTKPAFDLIAPHSDGAGVIESVGQGVPQSRVGERVWLWNGQWQRALGTCAEMICLPSEQAVALPEGISAETGAVMGIPGLTAAQTVFGGGDIAGKTLLVSGGAGTVGYLALQLAVAGGARVIATGSPSDFDRIRAAGAETVLDYRSATLAGEITEAAGGLIDRAIEPEFGANLDTLAEVMAPMGTIAAYGSAKDMAPTFPFGPMLFKALKVDITLIYLLPLPDRQAAIARLHDALAQGTLSVPIAECFDLADTAAAHEAVEAGGRAGAILVRPS